MKHLLPAWLLVTPVALLLAGVVWAELPCRTPDEAIAEAVQGYFLLQQAAASRCDEVLGGTTFMSLHQQLELRFGEQVGHARAVRASLFQRAYGETGAQELDRVNAMLTDLFTHTVDANADSCGRLKTELARRLTIAWSAIQERLERRMAAIVPTDQGICKD